MLPLLSTSLLDTLKILMLGNIMTFGNQMPATFQDMMSAQERIVSIDSIFTHDDGVECALLKSLYPEPYNCTSSFIQNHKVWEKENEKHANFIKLVTGYDVVYLQSNRIDYPLLYEIINSIDHVIGDDAIIILFQNYSTNTNLAAREKELEKQLNYFEQHNRSEKVTLLQVGDVFDMFMDQDPSKVLDRSGLPTMQGSEYIAMALFEIIRPYIY